MGWLIACLFGGLLWRTRRQLASLRRANSAPSVAESVQPAFASSQHLPLASRHLHNLVVLSLDLSHLRQAGGLDSARYADLTAQIDTLWGDIVRYEGTVPQSQAWQEARAAAWELLCEQHSRWESPPWAEETAPATPVETPEPNIAPPSARLHAELAYHVEIPPLPAVAASDVRTLPPALPVTAGEVPAAAEEAAQPLSMTSPASAEDTARYAWEPAAPSALERAMEAVAGWPALIAPFLVQNIGWFIGGLCFIAGSIFLVTYTT